MKKIFTICIVALCMLMPLSSYSQFITAQDDAGNYSDFSNGLNEGNGFGTWVISAQGAGGSYIGATGLSSNSFGIYAGGGGGNSAVASRTFDFALEIGTTFSFDLGYTSIASGGEIGISFFSGENWRMTLKFIGGNSYWKLNDGGSDFETTIPWDGTNPPLEISLTRGTGNNYTLVLSQNGITYNANDYTASSGEFSISKFDIYSIAQGSGENVGFDTFIIEASDPAKVPATADVTINGNVTLGASQALTVNDLSIPAGNSFTLESTASGTGSLIINGACTDEISVQRFLSGNWDWHFLSSPVVDQPIVGADNFIDFPGGIGDPSVDFYKHDETEMSGQPWINIKNENGTLNTSFGSPSSDPLFEEGWGYLVAYAGTKGDVTKTFTGVPFLDQAFMILTYTDGGGEGWNLVGNPYTSAVSWDQVRSDMGLTNLFTETYYVYNEAMNGGGGGFEWYTNLTSHSTNIEFGKIPAMQAFFVRSKNVGFPTMFLSKNSRLHDEQEYFKQDDGERSDRLQLSIAGENYNSDAYISISDDATTGVDATDAFLLFSLNSSVPHVYSLAGADKLVSNNVPFPVEDYSLQIGMKTGMPGSYTITAVGIENFNSSILPILEDTQTGAEIDLRFEGSYTFDVSESGINNSRFILHLKSAVGVTENSVVSEIAVSVIGNQLKVYNLEPGQNTVKIMDTMGRGLVSGKLDHDNTISLPASISAGTYILQVSNGDWQWVEKFVVD